VSSYTDFLARKTRHDPAEGPSIAPDDVHPMLHEWQRRIVAWAATTQRAAVWADTGLGKTLMQVEWARIVTGSGTGLIVAPLAVTRQTSQEAAKVGVTVRYARHHSDITHPGLWITNYERAANFDPFQLHSVVLDEASILKQSDGKTRTALIKQFADVPYRLACTATPAPNDPEELTNQAEFLGRSTRANMLAAFFVHDSDGWRLKGHAHSPVFRWMASWAVAIRRPSDMGFPDDGYLLPGLDIVQHTVDVPIEQDGQLFATDIGGIGGRAAVRRATLAQRCADAAGLVLADPSEPWLIWCGLNEESETLADLLPGAVNVRGNQPAEQKAESFIDFAEGRVKWLITKPSIAAFGLNWQHCARMVFVGISDSYESYYQAIRRCYRYGQRRPVQVHIVTSALESQIADNVRRKENEAAMVVDSMVKAMTQDGAWCLTTT
jgi:hypothetical protein